MKRETYGQIAEPALNKYLVEHYFINTILSLLYITRT